MKFKNLKYIFNRPKTVKGKFKYFKENPEQVGSAAKKKFRETTKKHPEKAMGASAATGALLGYVAGSGGPKGKEEARKAMKKEQRKYAEMDEMGGNEAHQEHHENLEQRMDNVEEHETKEETAERAKEKIDEVGEVAKKKVEEAVGENEGGEAMGRPGDTVKPSVGMSPTIGTDVGYHGDRDM